MWDHIVSPCIAKLTNRDECELAYHTLQVLK
jgi:hypothetical protein